MKKAVVIGACGHIGTYLFCFSCWAHGRAEVLPFDPDDAKKEPLDDYGKNKFASELLLKDAFRDSGFPAMVIMPGQISGPGWTIMNPWANKTLVPFRKIAAGEELLLPNFGMETLHHVHGADAAQCFLKAILHRPEEGALRWSPSRGTVARLRPPRPLPAEGGESVKSILAKSAKLAK